MTGMNYSEIRKAYKERDGKSFPAKPYSDLVLGPNYRHSAENHLYDMRQLNIAHVIMLEKQGLIPADLASSIMAAILDIPYESFEGREYSGRSEDLYFEIEKEIISRVGPKGGFVHLARSRNDLGAAMQRMLFRRKLLEAMESLVELSSVVLAAAEEYRDTLTIAHTHSQQAQPTTLGHYLMAVFYLLQRDFSRMQHAYSAIDLSPMGAAAITTSGFHVDRKMVAELTGFSRVLENAYDSIAGADFILEYASSIGTSAEDIGRFTADLIMWSTQEFGIIRLDDSVIQISSIMPQKRNPVALEHTRALLSQVYGKAITLSVMLHNTPYGDINDSEDDAATVASEMAGTYCGVLRLLSFLIATMSVDTSVLEKRLKGSFSVITELADTLVRNEGLSFREAHSVASALVSGCLDRKIMLDSVDYDMVRACYERVTGSSMKSSEADISRSLSARNFVNVRTAEGGPAPEPMEAMLEDGKCLLSGMEEAVSGIKERIGRAAEECERQAARMAGRD